MNTKNDLIKKASWGHLVGAVCWLAVFVLSLNANDNTFIAGVKTMVFLGTSIINAITFILMRVSTKRVN